MSGEENDLYYRNWQTQDHSSQNDGRGAAWSRLFPFDNSTGGAATWRLFSNYRPGRLGLPSNPAQPLSPFRIIILDENEIHQRLPQMFSSMPRTSSQLWQIGPSSPQGVVPGLASNDFKKAMSKMRNHIFSPTYPRRKAYKTGLFNRQSNSDHIQEEDEDNDEGRGCSICLEEFVSNEKLLVTPCNHMFHKACLVPWVKDHGKCPVCRYVFCEEARETSSRPTPGNNLSANRNVPDSNMLLQWSFFHI